MVAAENGYQNVFEHLIKNIKRYNVIINKTAINKSFRLAIINGYDNFSDYIWNTVQKDTKLLQNSKYNVLLEELIKSKNFDEAIKLVMDIIDRYDLDDLSDNSLSANISPIINISLSESPSYIFMNTFIREIKSKFGDIYK